MARTPKGPALTQLQAENERLQAEIERLKRTLVPTPAAPPRRSWRSVLAVLFALLAVLLLAAGNVLFWTGNTVVKNDRFTSSVAPVIRNHSVQTALASYTTTQLFKNVDVDAAVQNALPQQAAFLAPSIADQIQTRTESTLQKVAAAPKFQDTWNRILSGAQAKFIAVVKNSSGGTIDINDLYQQLSSSLQGTSLSFLANKQLPPKVGAITVASGPNIGRLHNVIVHIDTWRWLAIVLFVACAALAVYLAQRRRRMVVLISTWAVIGLFLTLVAGRILRENIAGQVNPQYADGVRSAVQIMLHPLVVQTTTILVLFVLVALAAWLTGSTASARYVQNRIRLLLAGKLHHALFGERENAFTWWVGRHKRLLQWVAVIVAAIILLMVRVTPGALLASVIAVVVVVLLIELVAAPSQPARAAHPG